MSLSLQMPSVRKVAEDRAGLVLRTLAPDRSLTGDPFEEMLDHLCGAPREECWLALAVMHAELPVEAQVRDLHRQGRLDGIAALREALTPRRPGLRQLLGSESAPRVRVLTGQVTVDVTHTAQTPLATGIQRVVRELTRRWDRDHEIDLVSWTDDFSAIRPLTEEERETALFGAEPVAAPPPETVVVPWRGTHILPELSVEPRRNERMLALVRYSRCRTGMVGYDCVPITTAETVVTAMGGRFAGALAVAREMDRIGALCRASAAEYQGWVEMLGALAIPGPQVRPVQLAVNDPVITPAALERTRVLLAMGRPDTEPLVLVVGSHEPRKNHGTVLQAAERLWREGLAFRLAFIGGQGWNSDAFRRRLDELAAAGRPVRTFSGLDDTQLWSAYRLATVTVFPSLNEGFGLPVAESLSCGTPVVTSGFGSMAEIAQAGGTVLVDPRDDDDVTAGLRRVLTEEDLLARLRDEAGRWPRRTWDDYAREMWDYLVAGVAS